MLIIPPAQFRRRRGRAKGVAAAVPGAALVLTEAIYNGGISFVVFQFDRAVNTAGLDGAQIRVDDQPSGYWYLATGGVSVLSPNSFQILLTLGGSTTGSAVLLNVGAGNGIVAVNDGGTWAGATNLVLPFG